MWYRISKSINDITARAIMIEAHVMEEVPR